MNGSPGPQIPAVRMTVERLRLARNVAVESDLTLTRVTVRLEAG